MHPTTQKKEENKIRILLTGGHAATTAISVVEELIRRQEKEAWDIYWIGSKSALEGKNIPTLESVHLPKLGVKCRHIISGRLQRKFGIWTIPSYLKIPVGFLHALILLKQIKPKIILSFGGYAAFPVVVVSRLMRIPVILHEQTASAGRANRLSAFFAKRIALARKSSLRYFPAKKCLMVGNPVMTQIAEIKTKQVLSDPPTLFILGGSRGSQRINCLFKPILSKLLAKYYLIHQTGELDFKEFQNLRTLMHKTQRERYEVYCNIDPMQIDGVYRRSDMVVARAGANTVTEIMVVKRPSLLIPIPFSYLVEQEKNAELAVKFGIAKLLKEDTLSSQELLHHIYLLQKEWQEMVDQVKGKESDDIFAARKLVDLLWEEVNVD